MQRIKRLNNYQKGVIIAMVIMALIFAVIYPKTLARVGYRYKNGMYKGKSSYTVNIAWDKSRAS